MSILNRQKMHYRNLGNSGLKVSRLGLAVGLANYPLLCNNNVLSTLSSSSVPNVNGSAINLAGEDSTEQIFSLAYEAGINYFDTFDLGQIGRTEIILGKIIKKKKWRRSSYMVSVRVHRSGVAETEKGLSRKHIVESVQSSLERLGLSYVDIVCAHGRDAATPVEEVVRAFSWIVEKGWAFYWGTCNWTQAEIMEAYTVARFLDLAPPLVDQSEYNFFKRQPVELVIPELLCSIGCGSITCSALANGLLSNDAMECIHSIGDFYQSTTDGLSQYHPQLTCTASELKSNYQTSRPVSLIELHTSPDRERVNEMTVFRQKVKYLRPIADQMGCSLSQLAIAWCLRTDFVQCCLISPANVDQLCEQLLALSAIDKLTPEVLAVIEKVLSNQPTLSTLTNPSSSIRSGRASISVKSAKDLQNNRRRSVTSAHRKSISSSPRLSISHAGAYEGRIGIRESVDNSNHDRRASHVPSHI